LSTSRIESLDHRLIAITRLTTKWAGKERVRSSWLFVCCSTLSIASGGIATSIALRISLDCITGDTSEKSFRFIGYSCDSEDTTPVYPTWSLTEPYWSQEHLDNLLSELKQQLIQIVEATKTEISINQALHVLPTLAQVKIQEAISQVCQQLNLSYSYLPSRAGHDTQEIGRFADMGMIFVPSRAGISHAEDEYTSPEQCIQGANVLLQTFLKLDRLYQA